MHFCAFCCLWIFKISRHTSGVVNVFCFSSASIPCILDAISPTTGTAMGRLLSISCGSISSWINCVSAAHPFYRVPITNSVVHQQAWQRQHCGANERAAAAERWMRIFKDHFRHRHWQEWNLSTFNKFTKLFISLWIRRAFAKDN